MSNIFYRIMSNTDLASDMTVTERWITSMLMHFSEVKCATRKLQVKLCRAVDGQQNCS